MSGVLGPVAAYYSKKVREYGPIPAGVDWNGEEGQRLRFEVLLGVAGAAGPFSIDDYGCGYGALLDHLQGIPGPRCDYLGIDVSGEMVERARKAHPGQEGRFFQGTTSPRTADFAVASGIFNVRLEAGPEDWSRHIEGCLDEMNAHSRLGFSFNCLSSYSDIPLRKGYLYYADPRLYFDLCKRRYSRNVALRHDYGLYEFTVIVRKGVNP
jgi:SAM-dependent methyltransferase